MSVDDPDDLAPALGRAVASGRPTVINVVVDPDAFPPIIGFERLRASQPTGIAARLGAVADPLFAVEGRRVVVTGGGRGIGLAAATAFLERGAAVELWDVRGDDLDGARAALTPGDPGRVDIERVDVSDADAVERAAARAESRGPVHVLVNSAGISAHRRPAIEIAQADWDRMLAVNLTGCWNACRALGGPCSPGAPARWSTWRPRTRSIRAQASRTTA